MTDKRKEKASASKPNLSSNAEIFNLVTLSQLSSQDIILRNSPTQMVNRFTTLGSTISPRPSFQSALISPSSPFDNLPSQKPFTRYPKSSPYHIKEPAHNLFLVEPDFSHLKSPDEIAKAYYPPRWHFPAIHPDKSIEYYMDILLVTKSIQVRPIQCQRIPGRVAFHSLFIMKFVAQKDWGAPPFVSRSLSNRKVGYSYHDYIEAWYKVLLYQNEDFSHSWFINFDRNFKGPIPVWFHRWWQVHGPVHQILPKEVKNAIRYFSTVKKLSLQENDLPMTVHFFAHFKVSWILKWQYVFITQNCVARQFSVKWWDKFNFSLVQSRLTKEFPERPPIVQDSVTHVSETQIEPTSPKPDSSTSSKGKKPSKIKQALKLMQQLVDAEKGNEDEEASTAESSVQHHFNFDAFQDAQDPYDFTDLDLDS
jgi:hypothetical protein